MCQPRWAASRIKVQKTVDLAPTQRVQNVSSTPVWGCPTAITHLKHFRKCPSFYHSHQFSSGTAMNYKTPISGKLAFTYVTCYMDPFNFPVSHTDTMDLLPTATLFY